jgi:hypothetical protein
MSVLNVNMPERDLDPEEIDLEQEEEDAFGESSSIRIAENAWHVWCRLTGRFLIQRFVDPNINSYLDCKFPPFLPVLRLNLIICVDAGAQAWSRADLQNWYTSLPGHDYFCDVHEDFIEDDFNLTGMSFSSYILLLFLPTTSSPVLRVFGVVVMNKLIYRPTLPHSILERSPRNGPRR